MGGFGSGKTTLAKQILEKHNLPIIRSDSLFHKYKSGPATLVKKVEEEISNHREWIYEDRHLFDSVLEQANEKIKYIKINFFLVNT